MNDDEIEAMLGDVFMDDLHSAESDDGFEPEIEEPMEDYDDDDGSPEWNP